MIHTCAKITHIDRLTTQNGPYIGLPMYKSILMILEVFPIFISYPPNSTLEIPKIALKKFFGAI